MCDVCHVTLSCAYPCIVSPKEKEKEKEKKYK